MGKALSDIEQFLIKGNVLTGIFVVIEALCIFYTAGPVHCVVIGKGLTDNVCHGFGFEIFPVERVFPAYFRKA